MGSGRVLAVFSPRLYTLMGIVGPMGKRQTAQYRALFAIPDSKISVLDFFLILL
jgi:hypothetical protein